eukprot:6186395-Pleurochrysis_carterae.AAC.2
MSRTRRRGARAANAQTGIQLQSAWGITCCKPAHAGSSSWRASFTVLSVTPERTRPTGGVRTW